MQPRRLSNFDSLQVVRPLAGQTHEGQFLFVLCSGSQHRRIDSCSQLSSWRIATDFLSVTWQFKGANNITMDVRGPGAINVLPRGFAGLRLRIIGTQGMMEQAIHTQHGQRLDICSGSQKSVVGFCGADPYSGKQGVSPSLLIRETKFADSL